MKWQSDSGLALIPTRLTANQPYDGDAGLVLVGCPHRINPEFSGNSARIPELDVPAAISHR